MNPPKIFISATSGDLSSARQIAKDALLTINCHPVEQTNFEPDWRSVTDMLRGKIEDCQALIHLVGFRYGAEPDPATLPGGTPRRSYTQMEYHLARELGLRVYTFLLPETYPFDVPAEADTPEQTQLQAAHRALVQSSPHLYEKPANDLDLRTRIIALQEKAISLEQEQQSIAKEVKTTRHWGVWAATAIVLILGGIGVWQWQTKKDTTAIATGQADLAAKMTEVQAALSRIQQNTDPKQDPIGKWPQERLEKELAQQMNFKVEDLRALLTAGKTSLDALVAGQALLASGRADEAGQKFDTVISQEQSALQRLQQAYAGKAQIAYDKARYEEALDYRQKAAALVDKTTDPVAWAEAQGWVTFIHLPLARYKEAEPLMREILRLREQHLGPNDTQTATSLNNLAMLLKDTNRFTEAELLMQRALKIDEASFGPDHPKIAIGINNLAQLLQATNRHAEAEPLMQRALKIEEATNGPNHPNVARALNNLATLLHETDRNAEAEPLMQRALKIDEATYGPDHPKVAIRLNNLARLLQTTNRYAEAEPMMQRALKIDEASFGPDHPEVATDLNNLALLLQDTKHFAEAEQLSLRMVGIFFVFQVSIRHQHPSSATALGNYLRLAREMKLSDADIHTRLDKLRQQTGLEVAAFESIWQEVLAANAIGPFQVVITEVFGQAEVLGLQAGDTYVSYNGQAITSRDQLIHLTGEAKGEAIPVDVLRAGKKLTFTAKPGKLGTTIENRPLPPADGATPAK